MSSVDDKGKVWIRGNVRPVAAFRIGETVIAPGDDPEDEIIEWVDSELLIVDIHNAGRNARILRVFPQGLEGQVSGTLFSGFDNTKHADVKIVTPGQRGHREFRVTGEDYSTAKDLSPDEFRKKYLDRVESV